MRTRFGIVVATAVLLAAGALPTTAQEGDVTISLARFFGDCDDTTQGVTDVKQATTECEVIQILTNAFNAAGNGITVEKLGGQNWADYYPQLSTTFAGGEPPDVAVMHQSKLADFASRDLLLDIGDEIAAAGVDYSDYTAPAQAAGQFEGTTYAVPFDLHGMLLHINMDLFAEAGLVDENGDPILPTSTAELLAQAAQFEEATGKQYYGQDWNEFIADGPRNLVALVAQQGKTISDGTVATVNTPEATAALEFLNALAEFSDVEQGYFAAGQAWLDGEIGVLYNGTWVVDQYSREAPFEYRVANYPNLFGTQATWGDSHMWVLPKQPDEDAAKHAAAIEFVTYLNEHIVDWAVGTGHMANRTSVLESAAYQEAPQRSNYADTADMVALVPSVPGWAGAWDALAEEVNATWLTGKDIGQALADAEARMNEELN
jgi:multiple sugar transport system substrate-binding protein